jgi:hypothetical protein
MSDTPKFTVIDRRKIKAEEEQENEQAAARDSKPEPEVSSGGPRLVVTEAKQAADAPSSAAPANAAPAPPEADAHPELPPAPTAEQSREQKTAYDASAQRLEDLIRAQNPAVGPQPAVTFEHVIQQFYVSAMIQMGAGAQEGQQPRVDILGARTTIDLLGVLAEKTRGNLTAPEQRMLDAVLFEVRMAFLELTSMISLQSVKPPPPPAPGKR